MNAIECLKRSGDTEYARMTLDQLRTSMRQLISLYGAVPLKEHTSDIASLIVNAIPSYVSDNAIRRAMCEVLTSSNEPELHRVAGTLRYGISPLLVVRVWGEGGVESAGTLPEDLRALKELPMDLQLAALGLGDEAPLPREIVKSQGFIAAQDAEMLYVQ